MEGNLVMQLLTCQKITLFRYYSSGQVYQLCESALKNSEKPVDLEDLLMKVLLLKALVQLILM